MIESKNENTIFNLLTNIITYMKDLGRYLIDNGFDVVFGHSDKINYGCCDNCKTFFQEGQQVKEMKGMEGKFLNIEFCNDFCLKQAIKKHYELNDIEFIDKPCTKNKTDNAKFMFFLNKYPQFIIKNFDDVVNSNSTNEPIFIDGIEFYILIQNIRKTGNDEFIQDCLDKNIV